MSAPNFPSKAVDFVVWQRKDDSPLCGTFRSNLFKADGSNLAVQMRNLQANLARGYIVTSIDEIKP